MNDLAQWGHEIGSHAHSHRALDNLSQSDVEEEVNGSHVILADVLGNAPAVFSYPHGGSSAAVQRALADAGYLYAMGTEERAVAPDDDPFFIPRFDTVTLKVFLDASII